MVSKLVPSDPSKVMVIRQVTPNITTCSAPFYRFGRFKVGGRGTIGTTLDAYRTTVLMIISSASPVRRPCSLLSYRSHNRGSLYT